MTLHTFGDSHRLYISSPDESKLQVKFGQGNSWTMAGFGMQKLNMLNIKNNDVKKNDMVLFSFGEIDCRCHLCKSKNFEKYKDIIDDNISSYFESIRVNVEQFDNLITMVYNVVPTVRATLKILERLGPDSGDRFPIIGSDDERKEVTLYTNLKLKEYCKNHNYIYFDVYNKYCDEEGFLNPILKDDYIHIKDTIHIKELLERFINENIN
jgi:hypothetical protein